MLLQFFKGRYLNHEWRIRKNEHNTNFAELFERAAQLGERITSGLRDQLRGNNTVTEVRNKGLMIAVELSNACPQLVLSALQKGLLLNVTQDNIVRLLPPLTLTDAEADELVSLTSQVINDG